MIPTDDRRAILQGNDLATSFAFSFYVFDESDLRVVKTDSNGNESTLTLGVDYSVTLSGSPGPGTVIYPATGSTLLATGETLTIYRNLSYTQQLDLTNAGSFQSEVVEKALDRLTMLVLQLREELDRVPSFPVSAEATGKEFPAPEALAFIGWNADGSRLENYPALDATDYIEQIDNTYIRRNTFTSDGVNTTDGTFTQQLSYTPATIDLIDVYVNGVRRAAGDASSVSLSGDDLTVYDVNIGDEIEVKGKLLAATVGTVGTVTPGAITATELADGSVTLSKLNTNVRLRRSQTGIIIPSSWSAKKQYSVGTSSVGGQPLAIFAVLTCFIDDAETGHKAGDRVIIPVGSLFSGDNAEVGFIHVKNTGNSSAVRTGKNGVMVPIAGDGSTDSHHRPSKVPTGGKWTLRFDVIGGW